MEGTPKFETAPEGKARRLSEAEIGVAQDTLKYETKAAAESPERLKQDVEERAMRAWKAHLPVWFRQEIESLGTGLTVKQLEEGLKEKEAEGNDVLIDVYKRALEFKAANGNV